MSQGEKITVDGAGKLIVPDKPIIPFIEGDGTGPDIWAASVKVFEAAVSKCYGEKRKIIWKEILAGEKAYNQTGEWLPDETVEAIREYVVAIKGPLTTPVGGGIRSINVALRQTLDLYACVRPVRHYAGVPSPCRYASKVDMMVFRENTEDVYAGIEAKADSAESKALIESVKKILGKDIREGSGIGIKPISKFGSVRLIERAVQYALKLKLPSVTLVHKGNIMKFTEGAFREWGYDLIKEKYADQVITEDEVWEKYDGKTPAGKLLIKDRIADNMFQQIQTRPDEYSVIATMNLNGDYLSDALAALVGGLGLAPGGNIGDAAAVFEATHGTAPKYAGQDKVNPGSVILSGKMMLDHMGWEEAATCIDVALEKAISDKVVTYDLARGMEGATEVSCSGFAEAICERM